MASDPSDDGARGRSLEPDPLRHLDQRLRDDVSLLGDILGRVIAGDRGSAFVARIERVRALAKEARSAGPAQATGGADWDALSRYLAGIPDDEITDIARAFNQFLKGDSL